MAIATDLTTTTKIPPTPRRRLRAITLLIKASIHECVRRLIDLIGNALEMALA